MTKRVFCIGNGESRKVLDLEKLRPHGKIYGCNALYRDFTPDHLSAVDMGIMHEIYNSGFCQNTPTLFRDWNRLPGMMYEQLLYAGKNYSDQDYDLIKREDVIKSNERGDCEEFVMHGSNLAGVVEILKKNKDREKKNINHTSINVSWVTKDDKVTSINDIMPPKDRGWACGATSGLLACINEKPKDVYLIGHDLNSKHQKLNNVYKSTRHYANQENAAIPSVNWIDQWKKIFREFKDINFWKVNEIVEDRSKAIYVNDDVNKKVLHWDGTVPNIKYIDFNELKRRLTLA